MDYSILRIGVIFCFLEKNKSRSLLYTIHKSELQIKES